MYFIYIWMVIMVKGEWKYFNNISLTVIMLCVCTKRVCVCNTELVCKAVRLAFSCQTSAISLPFIPIRWGLTLIASGFFVCFLTFISCSSLVSFSELTLFLISVRWAAGTIELTPTSCGSRRVRRKQMKSKITIGIR